ncbi:MAG: hypothetical protein KF901_32075 [Myxococcales bacterium]|nr:hypothetical protein [Myxococcales bacterium]
MGAQLATVLVMVVAMGCSVDPTGLALDSRFRDAQVPFDAPSDTAVETPDAAPDAATDVDANADPDGGHDGGTDGGGGADGGADGGLDAGADAGPDAGTCPSFPTLSGRVLHYDARRGVSLEDGDRVREWRDQSTSGNHAAGRDVRFVEDTFGPGLPSVRTLGTLESYVELDNPRVQNLTAFLVVRTTDDRDDPDWWNSPVLLGGDANGDRSDGAIILQGGRVGFVQRFGVVGTTTRIDDDAPHLVTVARSGAAVRIRLDGADAAMGTSSSGAIEDPSRWWLAAHEHPGGHLDAHYAVVLLYDRRLNDAETAEVEAHLRCVWRF